MRKLNVAGILKKGLVLSAALGALTGLLLGIVKGFSFIQANRYIELGMRDIAVYYFRSILNDSFLFPILVVVSAGLVVSLIHIAFRSLIKDKNRANRFILIVAVSAAFLILCLFGGYLLNKADWYPRATTLWGILFNALFVSGCLIIGLLAYRILRTGYGSFMKFFGLRLIFGVALLALAVNGYFYYDKFFNVHEGINVVFITVDTLRADHLSYDGYVRNTSPNIDALAREGVVFSNAFVQWPQTTPSLASMITGTYGHTNGVVGDTGRQLSLDKYFVLLPEVLKNDDYNTMGIVTNLYLASEFGFAQGFESYTEAWEEVEINGKTEHKGLDAAGVTEQAANWLRDNHKKGKFFMWLHYLDPHAEYTPPAPFNTMYVEDDFYNESERINLVAPDPAYPDIGGVREIARLGDNKILDYYISQYDGEIRYVDENIGILLNEIKKLGIYDNTLIVFTSDHGESLGEHNYYFWHGRLPYDDCLRVPFVIKFPADAKIPHERIARPVGLIGLLPTLLDFFGLPLPEEAEGQNLMPLIKGKDDNLPDHVFSEAGYEEDYQRIIRTDKWKLIYIPDRNIQKIMNDMPFELYDIQNDPDETDNLFNFETKVAVADGLRKELLEWVDSANIIDGISSPKSVKVDKETEEKLRSLGYIQ